MQVSGTGWAVATKPKICGAALAEVVKNMKVNAETIENNLARMVFS